MNLTSRQVADKLHCTTGTVLKLAREKKLTDLGKTKENEVRHQAIFNSTEVNEFAKTYRNRISPNGNKSIKVENINENAPTVFKLRLDRIEQKLDLLIKMWS